MINLKDKRGLEFKSAFFAIIIFSMVIIAIGVIILEFDNIYNSGITYDLNKYNQLDNISSTAKTQQDSIVVKSTNTGEEFEGTSIRGVFGILNNIYKPFRIVFGNNGMIDSVTERFGIPDYIRQGIVTMMIIAITFSLVAIFFRLGRKSV